MPVDDDTLRSDLMDLVRPTDDVEAIVADVERRRVQNHRRRTAVRLVAAASVLVLIGVATVALAIRDRDAEVVTAGPPTSEPETPAPTAPSGPSVTVTTTDLGPLRITASDPVPPAAPQAPWPGSSEVWLEHTLTIENTGAETVYVDDHRGGAFLGRDELLVADEGCGYYRSPGQPVTDPPWCNFDLRNHTIEPGQQVTSRIVLWRDLPGLEPVTSETFEFRKPIRYDTRGFADPERRPVEGQIVLTYEGLAGVGATEGSTTPTIGSTESRPDPPQGAAPGPDDDVPALFFDPPAGFDEHRSSETPGPEGGTILVYSFVLESWVVEGGIGQGLNVAVMRVPDELAEVHDPVAFAEQSMGSEHEFVEEELGSRRVAVARRSAVLSGEDLGLPDRVSGTYSLRIGEAAIQIHTMDVDEAAVVEALIASIDAQALARALAAAT